MLLVQSDGQHKLFKKGRFTAAMEPSIIRYGNDKKKKEKKKAVLHMSLLSPPRTILSARWLSQDDLVSLALLPLPLKDPALLSALEWDG